MKICKVSTTFSRKPWNSVLRVSWSKTWIRCTPAQRDLGNGSSSRKTTSTELETLSIWFQLEHFTEQVKEKVFMDLISSLSTMLICRFMRQSVKSERDFPTKFCKLLMISSKIRYRNSNRMSTELQTEVRFLMCGSTLAQCGRSRAQIFK